MSTVAPSLSDATAASSMLSKDDLTVVVPVLNEEEGIAAVLDEVNQNGYRNILVVDGYSTDSTAQIAQEHGATVITQHGKGKAGAMKTAIDYVTTPYMMVLDGDYTYAAADIDRFLTHTGFEEIVGARGLENRSRLHRIGNRVISMLFNALLGTSISDVCSGMYLLNSRSAKELDLRSRGFSVEVEILAQMAMQGRVTEMPISYRKRLGKEKLSTWVHGIEISRSVLSLARRYNPVFLFSLAAACAAVPGLGILLVVVWYWFATGIFRSVWALAGIMLLLLASQAFMVGTIAILIKRTEIRLQKLFRMELDSAKAQVASKRTD